MTMDEKAPSTGPRGPVAPFSQASLARRTLHRVETAALDLAVGVRVGADMVDAHLLNISAGGCSVRVQLPLTLLLESGVSVDVTLPLGEEPLALAGELTGLDVGHGSARLRLRFRGITPAARRALLVWIGELVTRDLQLRHSDGARKLSALDAE